MIKQCRALSIIFFTSSACFSIHASTVHDQVIIPVDSYDEMKPIFNEVSAKDLVIFDVDKTLIDYANQLRYAQQDDDIWQPLDDLPPSVKQRKLEIASEHIDRVELMDDRIPGLINDLQQRDIPVVALTNVDINLKGYGQHVMDRRFEQLDQFGMTMSYQDLNNGKHILFNKIKNPDTNRHPIMHKGIIYSCGVAKGKVAKEFMKIRESLRDDHAKPNHIIFVDDQMDNHLSMHAMCKKQHIQYTGFFYNPPHQTGWDINYDLVNSQIKHLIDYDEWLSDRDMKARRAAEHAEADHKMKAAQGMSASPLHPNGSMIENQGSSPSPVQHTPPQTLTLRDM